VITKEKLKKQDKKIKFIPITYDFAFKSVFIKNLNIFKKFLIAALELDIDPNLCNIKVDNTELPKEIYKEGSKTVDINVILNNNVHIEVELNRDYFDKVRKRNFRYIDKMSSMLINSGEKANETDKVLYQLNLNAKEKQIKYGKDIIVPYGTETGKIYEDNKFMVLKYLEYYRRIYYNEGDRNEETIWLTALTSRSFSELYEILKDVLTEKELTKFIGDVIKMSNEFLNFPLHEWGKEYFEEIERQYDLQKANEKGIKQGKKENSRKIAKNMLAMNLDVETISKATGLNIKEIEGLK